MSTPPPMPGHVKIAHALLLAGFASQIVIGHLVAFGLGSPLFAWHQDRVAEALWGSASFGPEVAAYRGWIQALLGGTMISYAWAMLFVSLGPLRRRELWAPWAIVVATLNWFIVDTSVSAYHGVWINVSFNALALGSIALPLLVMLPWLRHPGVGSE